MKKPAVIISAGLAVVAAGATTAVLLLTGGGSTVVRSCSTGNACWVCDQAVDLDSVDVTVTVDASSDRVDGVKLAAGCTGRIGVLTITTSNADAMKVAEGTHDLVVESGSIRCLGKLPTLHQDGVQVMGGSAITFHGLRIDCGRANETLIDSNLFINQSGTSTAPPSDVVCDTCWLGTDAAHTVSLQTSIRSGVRNSVICPAKFPKLTFKPGPEAVDPVTDGNTLPATC